MISVEGLKVEFNATALFEDVSYVINKKDRIALVGKNGAGKSTCSRYWQACNSLPPELLPFHANVLSGIYPR